MRRPKRYDSSAEQGAGSYVVMWQRTHRQAREQRAMLLRNGELRERQIKKLDRDKKPEDDSLLLEQQIIEAIVEWNWTDAAGERLPLPKDDPEVLEDLHDNELAFLMRAFLGNVDGQLDEKN